MFTALLIIDILVCLSLIGLILMQHGKGADVGAAFGSGASQTVFGSQGSGSFLTRSTAILAVLFFVISLSLAYLYGQNPKGGGVVDILPAQQISPQTPDLPPPNPASSTDVPNIPPLAPATDKPQNNGATGVEVAPLQGSPSGASNGSTESQQTPADVPTP